MNSLVLIHGFTGGPESWDEVVGALPGAEVPIRVTLLGHHPAGTRPERGAVDFLGEVDRIAAELRAGRHRDLDLCGYSMGARVALALLVRHGELFRRGTLIGVHPGLRANAFEERRARAVDDERWARCLETDGLAAFASAWAAQPLFATQRAEQRAAEHRRRLARDPAGLALALRALGLATMPDFGAELSRLTMPLRLVVGALDAKFCALAESMLPQLARGRLHVVADTGHNVVLERPEWLASLLREP